jgi:hypothetical protein
MRTWIRDHRRLVWSAAVAAVIGLVVVLVWFQPQRLFQDVRVDEALPGAATTVGAAVTTTTAPPIATTTTGADEPAPSTTTTTTTPPTTTQPAGPVVLHESELIDVGHEGTGDVLVIELPDGSRLVRFEDLDVTNGPDLRVILSPSALVEDRNAYDDGNFVDLGPLEGNQGNQNYEIPADVDLGEYSTVAIWCRRFNYTFNAGTIT